MTIAKDKHYYPIEITSGMQLKIDSTVVTLTAGTYWTHFDTTLSSYPSLYQMMCSRIATVYGGSWDIEPITPANGVLRSGVRLKKIGGSAPTQIDFSETTGLVQRVLGFSGTETGLVAFNGYVLDGEFSAYGAWSPYSFFAGRAEIKDSHMERVTNWSSTHPEVAQAVIWRERRYRVISYPYVYGGYINQNRNKYDEYTQYSGLATNDFNNSLENLWTVAGRDIGTIIVVHDLDELDLEVSVHEYEIVKLADVKACESMESLATRAMMGADVWNVKIPYVILGGSYGL